MIRSSNLQDCMQFGLNFSKNLSSNLSTSNIWFLIGLVWPMFERTTFLLSTKVKIQHLLNISQIFMFIKLPYVEFLVVFLYIPWGLTYHKSNWGINNSSVIPMSVKCDEVIYHVLRSWKSNWLSASLLFLLPLCHNRSISRCWTGRRFLQFPHLRFRNTRCSKPVVRGRFSGPRNSPFFGWSALHLAFSNLIMQARKHGHFSSF